MRLPRTARFGSRRGRTPIATGPAAAAGEHAFITGEPAFIMGEPVSGADERLISPTARPVTTRKGLLARGRRWSVEDEAFNAAKRPLSDAGEGRSEADERVLVLSDRVLMTSKPSSVSLAAPLVAMN